MQHAVKSCPMDVVEEYFWGKNCSPCARATGQGNHWVHSNGVSGKPTFHRRSNLSWLSKIFNNFREIDSGSWKSLTLIKQKWRFFGKRPLMGIFSQMFSKNPHADTETRVFVQISWNLADRKSVKSSMDKKDKISAPAAASARIPPKICQGQLQSIYSEFPKFHPNPFTSGGVIAERVNIVQTRHKVFAILCEASASSPSN